MKKKISILLVFGLVAGMLFAPAEAGQKKKKKKKKKPPVAAPQFVEKELTFYLRWDDDGAGGCAGAQYLSLEDGEDPGSGCAYTFQPANEVFHATGAEDPLVREWPAANGVPFKIDASRKVMATMVVRGSGNPQARLDLGLTGSVKDTVSDIASGSTGNFTLASSGSSAQGPQTFNVEMEIDKALDKADLSTLVLSTEFRGAAASIYIDLEGPSFITIPVLVPAN